MCAGDVELLALARPTRAAAELHVTAPAVSNSLARLRALLGDALLVRRGRSLVPTPRAVDLAPQLQAALGTLQRALDERFDPAATRRRFALALSDAGEACSAPDIAVAVTARMPHAGLQIVSLDTLAASDGLATGAVPRQPSPCSRTCMGRPCTRRKGSSWSTGRTACPRV